MLPFQNCTPSLVDGQSTEGPTNSAPRFDNTSGGNGEPYGGKLTPGNYVRALIDFKCGPRKNLGEINVSAQGTITGSFTDPTSCVSIPLDQLTSADLEHALYEPNRVGLDEGIYTKVSNSNLSRGLVDEAWCRTPGSSPNMGYDVVIKADYAKNEFRSYVVAAQIRRKKLERTEYQSGQLDRDVDVEERIRYRSGEDDEVFRVDIDTRTFDRSTGKMAGVLDFETGPFDSEVAVECRVGGKLDIHFSGKPYDLSAHADPLRLLKTAASALHQRVFSTIP